MILVRLLPLAAALALGCGPAEAPLAADAVADATLPPPADVPLLAAEGLAVWASPDLGRLELRQDGRIRLSGLQAGFDIGGERWLTDAWPDRSWLLAGPEAEGLFTGAPGLPDLVWALRLSADQLTSTVTLRATTRPVEVDRLLLLVGDPPEGRALPEDPGPWQPVEAVGLRRGGQLMATAAGHLALRGEGIQVALRPALEVWLAAPPLSLRPGDRRTGPPLILSPAPWPLPAPPAAPPPAWGWRSGAWGSAVDGALLRRQAAALQPLLPDPPPAAWPAAPLLLVEGLWYAGPGDWRPGLSFPGGLAGLRAAALPARLAWRWPALHAPQDAPVAVNRPAARLPDTPRCAAPGCLNLNPALPAVRDAVARAAAAFAEDAAVWLSDLPTPERVDPAARAALFEELAALYPALHLAGEALPGAAPWAGFAPDDPCEAAAREGAPWPPRCAGWLATADARRPPPPEDLRAERALAWALLGALGGPVDPGPIRLAQRPPGAARLAATLAAISGGPRLLGDDLEALGPAQAALARRLWAAPPATGRALDPGDVDPPAAWAAADLRAAVNWGPGQAEIALPAGRWRDLWTDAVFEGAASVPPEDGRLLRRDPTAAVVGGDPDRVENPP